MKKKVLIGVIVTVLLAGIIGYLVVSSGSEPTIIIQPTPSQPVPTQPTLPTPTVKTKTVPEVVSAVLAGKYKRGDVIRISGVVTGERRNDARQIFIYLGPAGDSGLFVFFSVYIDSSDEYVKFYTLKKGERIVIEGTYREVDEGWKGIEIRGVGMNNPILISREPPE